MRSVIKIFGFSVALLSAAPALAGPNECKEAVDKYNQASTDISDYLRRYSSCVASSQGQAGIQKKCGLAVKGKDQPKRAGKVH